MPERFINDLFRRFLAFYGTAWSDRWAGVDLALVKGTWAAELAECTPQQIADAMQALTGAFPPSLPEFRALCKQFRPRPTSNVFTLPDKRPPPPQVMENIRAILKKAGAQSAPIAEEDGDAMVE